MQAATRQSDHFGLKIMRERSVAMPRTPIPAVFYPFAHPAILCYTKQNQEFAL